MLNLPEDEIKGMLYRHSKHDWVDAGKESWAMNDEVGNAKQGLSSAPTHSLMAPVA